MEITTNRSAGTNAIVSSHNADWKCAVGRRPNVNGVIEKIPPTRNIMRISSASGGNESATRNWLLKPNRLAK